VSNYIAAIDQGTTSTRFMIFDHGGNVITVDQKEHKQIYPKPGWVEHDPLEIWESAAFRRFRDGLAGGDPDLPCRTCPKRYII